MVQIGISFQRRWVFDYPSLTNSMRPVRRRQRARHRWSQPRIQKSFLEVERVLEVEKGLGMPESEEQPRAKPPRSKRQIQMSSTTINMETGGRVP